MFKVKEIVNGGEIVIERNWLWERKMGNKVRVLGYFPPIDEREEGYEYAKGKLTALLQGKSINLFSPTFIDKYGTDILFCHVYLNGTDIKNYFPEFK